MSLPIELLDQRIITERGCWEWTGSHNDQGYGRITWQGRSIGVHRLVCHLVHGLDLSDRALVARHTCDNPPCFNPAHLLPGTYSENVKDALERGRARGFGVPREECPSGHPLVDGNLKWDYRGRRRCRTCDLASQKSYYDRRKAEQGAYWRAQDVDCTECGQRLRKRSLREHVQRKHASALDGGER